MKKVPAEIGRALLAAAAAAFSTGAVSFYRGNFATSPLVSFALFGAALWLVLRLIVFRKSRGRRSPAPIAAYFISVVILSFITHRAEPTSVSYLPLGDESGAELSGPLHDALKVKVTGPFRTETRAASRMPLVPGLAFSLAVPKDGVLNLGALAESKGRPVGDVVIEVAIGGQAGVGRRKIGEVATSAEGWSDVSIDLSGFGPGRAGVSLQVASGELGHLKETSLWVSGPRVSTRSGAPNLMLIVIDTLRADHLSCDPAAPRATPNLAKWAARGTWFTRNYSQSSWTLPSIASISTSRMPAETGAVNVSEFKLEDRNLTLAETLSSLGYGTAMVTANRVISAGNGFDQGFDSFVSVKSRLRYSLGNAHRVNRETLDIIERASPPFFVFALYIDPHMPYLAPWSDADYAGVLGQAFFSSAGAMLDNFMSSSITGYRRPAPWSVEANKRLYDGEVRYVDRALGELFEELEKRGLLENLVVVIASDHGEEFAEHGLTGHGTSLFEELIRVPLVVIDFREEGQKVARWDGLTTNLDVAPTLLDLAGFPPAEGMLGKSLRPVMMGQYESRERAAFSELPEILHYGELEEIHRPGLRDSYLRSMVREKKKLISHVNLKDKGVTISAFDLALDPSEVMDLKIDPPPWMSGSREEMELFFGDMPDPHDLPRGEPLDAGTLDLLKTLGYVQ